MAKNILEEINEDIYADSQLDFYKNNTRYIITRYCIATIFLLVTIAITFYLYWKGVYTKPQCYVLTVLLIVILVPVILKEWACFSLSKNKACNLLLKLAIIFNVPSKWVSHRYCTLVNKLKLKKFMEVIPEYLLAFEITLFIFMAIFGCVASYMKEHQDYLLDESAAFICIIIPLICFKGLGNFFSYISRKTVVYWSFKNELKKKGLAKATIRSQLHTKENRIQRKSMVKAKLDEIKTEKKIASIIAYILAMLFFLLIPHHENQLTSLLVEEAVGIIAIMALVRELYNEIQS
ncbi:MAG: hypothetical protein E7273_06780 [Pseudobutyrivibrio ruminis]|nr:hypothetical protein [Pseudobutyrivibrio ruminis]